MNQVFLVAIIVVATLSIAAFGTTSIALAQNMSGGTPEKSKFPGNETFAGNATDTTITQGLSPNSTAATDN